MSNCSSITLGYLWIRHAYFWIRATYFPRSGSCWRINGHFSEKYSVSPLCQRVSPFETLHALYLLGLCQRVTLFCKKHNIWTAFFGWPKTAGHTWPALYLSEGNQAARSNCSSSLSVLPSSHATVPHIVALLGFSFHAAKIRISEQTTKKIKFIFSFERKIATPHSLRIFEIYLKDMKFFR